MKKIQFIYKSLLGVMIASALFSCQNDFEDVPLEQFTQDYVFSTADSTGEVAKQYLNTVYSRLQNGHNRVGGDYLASATDDAISSSNTLTDADKLLTGAYNASLTVGSEMLWGYHYAGIRSSTEFITNIDIVPVQQQYNGMSLAKVWKSEARFIRAWHYFNLVKRYGGVPLMGDVVRQLGDDLEIPRSSFDECISYIVSELNDITGTLRTYPVSNPSSDAHVVTREAAMALKARVLLYAASPLFNGGNIDGSNPLTGYASLDNEKWKAAADAAKQLMDEGTFSLQANYLDVFLEEGNSEVIFFRPEGPNNVMETNNGPVGFSGQGLGQGRTSPSQNLVDAFPMLDGKSIGDPTSAYVYNQNDPYANRDPRLENTVLHNGSLWLNTILETFEGGKNRPGGALQQTRTSYYLRKFMGKFETASGYSSTTHDWVVFRYAEVMLNYAEAQNEYSGPSTDIYQVLKDLRARSGIEAGLDDMYGLKAGMSKDEMREAIHNERRIEMAFEEQRYWDLRRWKKAESVLNNAINGMVIIQSGPTFIYNETAVLTPSFETRQYLYPIPNDEVLKNDNMIQNPNW
ncbi:RagB/SusD family nutrient uptake outer membrane protein [Fulvivirga ligni]|uniref:RagB/SusD family nutrient uptake outer membrane protein n=1 Tax=Fulvivirga ligni TaxID=2904246 RepID=UPI001F1AC728|nr:RagB/SusD family nutrient uptake outer membrane protein [Fulvivirga ligni]UII19554.1 RagB/SusD family nutrient uptake outer membrane protein [Fulvivirga ligni]